MCKYCKVEAGLLRTLAAADNQYTEWLHELGFSGLTVLKAPDDYARAKFEDWNKFQLIQNFGFPHTAEGHVAFDVENGKGIWVSEENQIVLVKKLATRTEVKNPLNKVDERPITKDAEVKVGGKELEPAYLEAQATEGNEAKLAFMQHAWVFYNGAHFGHELKPCKFLIGRNMGTGFKNRGMWRPGPRELQISSRVFNAPFDVFVEVFVHEMCHQAVTDIDKADMEADNIAEKGHGVNWKIWMRKCGLNPARYDSTDTVKYMTGEEAVKKAKQRNAVNKETHGRTKKSISMSFNWSQPDWASLLTNQKGDIVMVDGAMVWKKGTKEPVFVALTGRGMMQWNLTAKLRNAFLYERTSEPTQRERDAMQRFIQPNVIGS